MKSRILLLLLSLFLVYSTSAQSQKRLKSDKQIPILAWYSVPANETSVARYEELKESGISYSFTSFKNEKEITKALKAARKAGVKLVISCPELKTETERIVKKYKHNPAVAGYFLADEPGPAAIPGLAKWVKKIHSIDSKHFCYINLLPNYADMKQLGLKNYREYVHLFIKEVPIKYLSFDFYPVVGNSLRERWYENLEVFANEARKAGKPFWAFALTVSHGPYPIPTVAMLRLEIFSDLAYGAQAIQYFTYWTPKGTRWDFHHGPITLDSKRSDVYDRMKEVNSEIKQLSWVFSGAKVLSVAHTGDTIPLGTKRLSKLPNPIKSLKTEGKGAVVSVLQNGKDSFLVIVNRDFINPMKLTIDCDSTVGKVLKDGSTVPAKGYMNTMEIDPGDVAIYTWKTNH
jgi:hypothetical protein